MLMKIGQHQLGKSDQSKPNEPVIVIGTGPVGIRVVQEIQKRDPGIEIIIFGNEPWQPYNRVRLSSYLAGELGWEGIDNAINLPDEINVTQHHNCAIESIDPFTRTVTDQEGRVHCYWKLVIATGSAPRVPNINGIAKEGVYTFRDLNDVEALIARRARSHNTVVLGGGLLGLEAARAMMRFNTKVTVIDHSEHLLFNQLDSISGNLLKQDAEKLGINIITGVGVKEVTGDLRVEGVTLLDKQSIECDTLIVCTGIKPNIELIKQARLPFNQGITVDDTMRSVDEHIYAVGECAEHNGQLYGLVGPGFEQAGVAVHHMFGGKANYTGSIAASRLKVLGQHVFSMGKVGDAFADPGYQFHSYHDEKNNTYRKIALFRGTLRGVIAYGEWPQLSRTQEAVAKTRRLFPWHIRRFVKTGDIWPQQEATSVVEWPAEATVCNCTGVTRGTLGDAIALGCANVETLCQRTGASTVCGSCKPLVIELVQHSGAANDSAISAPASTDKRLSIVAIIALVLALIFVLLPPIPYSSSVQSGFRLDMVWLDGFWKQFTGYSLLAVSVIGLLLSARKRLAWMKKLGEYVSWRLIHTILGALLVATLYLHTGMRLGEQLNFALMSVFILILISGALMGAIIANETKLDIGMAQKLRKWTFWGHVGLFWPLPALLGFHILAAYYY